MRPVPLLKPVQVCLGKGHVECGHRIVKVLHFGGSDDGCSHAWLMQQPGQGDLGRREAAFGC
jgi:hypothetical protein